MIRAQVLLVAMLVAVGLVSARSDATPETETRWRMEPVVEGLDYPWGVAFLPRGVFLVSEREKGVRAVRNGKILPLISGVPTAYTRRQGGYLDVAIDPDFARTRFVYLSLSTGSQEANRTEIIRGRLSRNLRRLTEVTSIFRVRPDKHGGAHFGSRIAFLPDGTLVFGLGEGYHNREEAQNTGNHLGSAIRLGRDGSVPDDNPYVGSQEARAEIFSHGHRNMQGLAYDAKSGHLFGVEHGPRGGDELNLLQPGNNYGWPRVTFGTNYDGSAISSNTHGPGFTAPLHVWVPSSIAPSSMAVYRGSRYRELDGDILISTLINQDIRRLEMAYDDSGPRVVSESVLIETDSRLRQIAIDPTGDIFVLTDEEGGGLYRLVQD